MQEQSRAARIQKEQDSVISGVQGHLQCKNNREQQEGRTAGNTMGRARGYGEGSSHTQIKILWPYSRCGFC